MSLPVAPASSFLGREAELSEAELLLGRTRLLTVSGPGGAGKTRFALELARRAGEQRSVFADGVHTCFLASLRDPELVLPTLCQTLDVGEQPGKTALEALAADLNDKRALVLLDNFEHLQSAGPDLSRLLDHAETLTLLVTSREQLRLPDETEYRLPPLAEDEGVLLFCERARLEPTATISHVCQRLDGLPLAIELAAARTRLLTPEQLLDRLSTRLDLLKGPRDADPRQQTLRATIEWSYDLLTADEQRLFARLSVFAGGCTLEAAEQVCDDDLDTLESLLDKSLLRRTDNRFWMLETIREYAVERLAESGLMEQFLHAHAATYTSLAEEALPQLFGSGQREWLERIEPDASNFRAALDYALVGDPEVALRLAVALTPFWRARARIREGRAYLDAALSKAAPLPSALVATALNNVSIFAEIQGDASAARSAAERALQLAREIGDVDQEASALNNLAASAMAEGDIERAAAMLQETRSLAESIGDELGVAIATANLGRLEYLVGSLDSADELLGQAVGRARRVGAVDFLSHTLRELGVVKLMKHEHQEARPLLAEALQLAVEIGDAEKAAYGLEALAIEAVQGGQALRAARLAGAAEQVRDELGSKSDLDDAEFLERHLEGARESAGEEAFRAAYAEGVGMALDEVAAYAVAEDD